MAVVGTWKKLLGTLLSTFKIGKSTLDASGLSGPRTYTLPDATGTLPLLERSNTFTNNQTITLTNATTAAVDTVLVVGHNSSGTPASNFGAALAFQLASSTTNDRSAGRVEASWDVATDASRAAKLVFYVAGGGTDYELLRLRPNASAILSSDLVIGGNLTVD